MERLFTPRFKRLAAFLPLAAFLSLAVGIGLASSAGCMAPKSELPAADAAALERERLVQQELAFTVRRQRRQRLAELSWPLRRGGAALCGDRVAAEFGFSFESSDQYDRKERAAASRALGLDRMPTVTVVVGGGPAAYADIRPGDILTHVGRYRLPRGQRGVEHGIRRLREFSPEGPPFPAVPVRLEREGEAYIQELLPELLCEFPVELYEDASINAFADGSKAYITTGMMRFTENDEELQVVIAHELAHNIERHVAAARTNAVFGALLGLAAEAVLEAAAGVNTGGALVLAGLSAGSRAHSQDFEREADYVGMYLLARAAVDTSSVAMFWRRLAAENSGSIQNNHRSTHPSTPERFVRLEATHREIKEKRTAGRSLVPNSKTDSDPGP